MGRKKRKVVTEAAPEPVVVPPPSMDLPIPPVNSIPRIPAQQAVVVPKEELKAEEPKNEEASKYSMKAHGAEIIDEDIYVSDGSEDEEEHEIEMLLVGARLGVMRKGIHHQMLVQPNRQWTRKTEQTESDEKEDEEAEQKRQKEQEEELANLDPAQRAARLLVEKQRKLEEAKENARRLESEENAGRDPCLFSKRTAFDIRFDQIDDKPWTRGDTTDYFNYGLLEEDWLEYSQQQLMIRQELTDASRQRRAPDPTLVPVTPRVPSKQQPKVAVAPTGTTEGDDDEDAVDQSKFICRECGPVLVKKEPKAAATDSSSSGPNASEKQDIEVGAGGAWGAGAAPGSVLAKLIKEQEKKMSGGDNDSYMDSSHDGSSPSKSRYGRNNNDWHHQEQSHKTPPPPPQSENRWQQQHPGTDNNNNNSYYGNNNSATSGNEWSQDRSSRGGSHYQQLQQQQQQSHYQQQQQQTPSQQQQRLDPRDPRGGRGHYGGGRGGGRGYMGGGRGRGGGRGYYNDSGRGGGGHYGGDSYHRKRSRDSYDDHGGSRGWRR